MMPDHDPARMARAQAKRARKAYRFHVQDHSGRWTETFGEVSRSEGAGYLMCHRECPSPRLPVRLVRSDGRVVDESPGREGASLGAGVGFPEASTYLFAAAKAIEAAVAIQERRRRHPRGAPHPEVEARALDAVRDALARVTP